MQTQNYVYYMHFLVLKESEQKCMLGHSDRNASSQPLHYGSSSHIFYMLYVDLQVIGHEEFISEVKINIRAF